MSREGQLAKNTVILTIGKLCTQFVSFMLLPLYTSVLSTEEYGTFDLLCTYWTLLLPIVGAQLDQGLFRFLFDCRDEKKKQRSLFTTVLCIDIRNALIFGLLAIVLQVFLKIHYGAYVILIVFAYSITNLLLQFERGLGDTVTYSIASFISAFSTIVLNIVTILIYSMGTEGLLIATLASQIITALFLIFHRKIWNYFSISQYDKSIAKRVEAYSLPLIPNSISWWMVSASDRLVINMFLGAAANGIYTVSNKFPNVFISFYNIFVLSWTENVTRFFNDVDRDEYLSKMITQMYNLFSAACFGIVACMPFVFTWIVNDNYAESYNQIPILMYAMLFRVLVGLYSAIFVAQKQSKLVMYTAIGAGIINIVTNLLLVNYIGLYAASASTLIAFAVMFIIRYYTINKTMSLKISAKSWWASGALCIFATITYYSNNVILHLITLLLTVIYGIYFNQEFCLAIVKKARTLLKIH